MAGPVGMPATLEWLETHGVTVDVRAETPEEAAALFWAQRGLGLPGGMLVTVPAPAEFELPADQMESAIAEAVEEADGQGVKGRALTPFLLVRITEWTGEASRRANLARLENNARVAAQIAPGAKSLEKSPGSCRSPGDWLTG